MRFLGIILFVMLCTPVWATYLPDALKTHADTTPREIRKNHIELATYLAAPCKNETEKAIIFTYWVAKNIRYDLKESRVNDRNKIAREVLEDRTAVCGGYSRLMKKLCDNVGLRCYYVSGYAWGGFFEHYLSQDKNRHAWNVVHVDGEWKLLDATWSRSELKSKVFRNAGTIKWIFMDPEKYAQTHLPLDPRWQLLDDPKTNDEFWKKKDLVTRKYASKDSLNMLLSKDWVDARIISIKGSYTENQDVEEFINDLNLLGFELVGGSYDSINIARSVVVFKLSKSYDQTFEPYHNHKDHLAVINTGLWLAKRRMEMKE
jgi:hypothetical protein